MRAVVWGQGAQIGTGMDVHADRSFPFIGLITIKIIIMVAAR